VQVVIGLIVVILVVALGGVITVVIKSMSAEVAAKPVAEPEELAPALVDFHVHGEEAQVHFGVPLGEPVGPVLRDLLFHAAVDVLDEKREHGLPLEGIRRIRVFGQRDGAAAEVGTVDLPGDGGLPEIRAPELLPRAAFPGYDPLAHLGEHAPEAPPGVVERIPTEELPSWREELQIPMALEVALRTQGIDPATAGLTDVVVGLFRAAGYALTVVAHGLELPGARADVFRARRSEDDILLAVVPHRSGEYPELGEAIVQRFLVWFGEQSPARALLVTDKYGPYLIYEKERREPRCRFVTRERLQAFVDGFVLR